MVEVTSSATGGTPASDLIQEAEMSFLQSCVADMQQALRESAAGPAAGYGREASQTNASESKKKRLHSACHC